MTRRIDLSGKRFGRWTVLDYVGGQCWRCRCKCGAEHTVDGRSLRAGRSNGCIRCHTAKGHQRKHGGTNTRLYAIWCHIKGRCQTPSNAAYDRYGGRGISVCPEWSDSFLQFKRWADANGYRSDLTIDRVDNDGNHEPSNCRWATKAEQNRNYSRVRYVAINGERVPLIDLAERAGLKPYTVRQRIYRMGWSVEKALTTPVRGQALKEIITFTVEQRNIDAEDTARAASSDGAAA